MAIRMPKKPKPAKPLEWRPWPGSAIRITAEAGTPIPLLFKDLVLNLKKGD